MFDLCHSLELGVGLFRLRPPCLTGSSTNFRYLHITSSSTPKREDRNPDVIAFITPSKNTLRHLLYDEHIATPSGENFSSRLKLFEEISYLP